VARHHCTWFRTLPALVALMILARPAAAGDCEGESFSSTFELIQKAIFERTGCAESICHGSALAPHNLDLSSAEASYNSLVDVGAATVAGIKRVEIGQKDRSLLFINLAAKTFPGQWTAPLRPMPADPVPALNGDELEVIRRWIEVGAPREGVVDGTADLLNACLPPPEPLQITPLPPPPAGTGVQMHMPIRTLPAKYEEEVCFATYYDLTDQVPEQFRGPSGTTFRYKRAQVRQDPLSHHLIVNLYRGSAPADDRRWGTYRCRGGARNGESCNPLDLDFCGEGSGCAADPVKGVACIGYGPGDAGVGVASSGFIGTQETHADFDYAPGVYAELPLKGIVMWNSHVFNLTDTPGKIEAWVNFEFAAPEEQVTPVRGIFNTSEIFALSSTPVMPFTTREVCNIHLGCTAPGQTNCIPPNAHIYELSSHTHRFGKRFRTFEGAWRCQGGPRNGNACSPLGTDFDSPELCPQGQCVSTKVGRAGDCDGNGRVSIDEVVTGLNILFNPALMDGCPESDVDEGGTVTVDEVLMAIDAALTGEIPRVNRDPEESLLYVNLIYNDPLTVRFDPPMVAPGPESSPDDRSFTYCSLYDNGFTNPAEVKRRSTSPIPPLNIGLTGGPCQTPTHCAEGNVGAPCGSHADCDSSDGAGDGSCDACPLRGGVTTEDEMFILIGQYYVP
jgi:hypothetical protein